ncbi:MAG: helix-turn-helix transcriptional regulator [Oscillospiraceae bacterium]|nr:helix-turn-helix transcriptional regulator [Oscillospiraceae bacterium]
MTLKMRKWIHEHGVTAARIGELAGVEPQKLYRWLRGEQEPGPELRATLCGIFGMTDQEYQEAVP